MSRYIKVSAVRSTFPQGHAQEGQPQVDKNGRHYETLTLTPPTYTVEVDEMGVKFPVKRQVRSVGGINVYKESYLPSLKGGSDFGFGSQVGEALEGDIVTRRVEAYELNGRQVDRVSFVVFANTDDNDLFTRRLASVAKSKNHVILDWTAEEEVILAAAAARAEAAGVPTPENAA